MTEQIITLSLLAMVLVVTLTINRDYNVILLQNELEKERLKVKLLKSHLQWVVSKTHNTMIADVCYDALKKLK